MTKDEIKLVTFIILALLVGTIAKRYRDERTTAAIPPVAEPARPARPPYVFKDAKALRKATAEIEKEAP